MKDLRIFLSLLLLVACCSCTSGLWVPLSDLDAPAPRSQHTAVWSGTEMLVWGGSGSIDGSIPYLGTGGRYDPAVDAWAPTSMLDAPTGRVAHTSIWTGREMIVWGGWESEECCVFGSGLVPLPTATGSRYDPETDSWARVPTSGAPAPLATHTAVWSGTEMIVWGGVTLSADGWIDAPSGARYDPDRDLWTPVSEDSAPEPRRLHTAIWTGTEMIVWGGTINENNGALTAGGRYDPVTDRWAPTSPAPIDGRTLHAAVWTGREMIVWGGESCSDGTCQALDTGASYTPETDTWVPTSRYRTPRSRIHNTAVWTGEQMIVWGGRGLDFFADGGTYDPDNDRWSRLKSEDLEARELHGAVWTDTEMIVWGGHFARSLVDIVFLNDGGAYVPAIDE